MNCKDIHRLLSAYQDKEISPVEASALEAHLAGCQACATEHRRFSQAWDMLGSLASIAPSPDFKARFWERVREEEAKPRLWDWLRWPRLVPALAGGMALWVLGIGGGVLLFERHTAQAMPATNTALRIFTAPYPPNSIEQVYLQGSPDVRGRRL